MTSTGFIVVRRRVAERLAAVRGYYRRQHRAALSHGTEWSHLYGLGPSVDDATHDRMVEHAWAQQAALYGCSVDAIVRGRIITSGGDLDPQRVATGRAGLHQLQHGWRNLLATVVALVDRADPGARGARPHDVLGRELRGWSRAAWLISLWRDLDLTMWPRQQWYSSAECAPYWPLAYVLCGESRLAQQARSDFIWYGRALVWRYSEVHPSASTHAAAAYVEAVEAMWEQPVGVLPDFGMAETVERRAA